MEATVTGEKENVDTFVEWCKSGPEKAVVDEVIVTNMEETIFLEFDLKR